MGVLNWVVTFPLLFDIYITCIVSPWHKYSRVVTMLLLMLEDDKMYVALLIETCVSKYYRLLL